MKRHCRVSRKRIAVRLSTSLLAVSLFLGGCSKTPLVVAVPEKSIVARLPLDISGWQDLAMCTLKLRSACKDLNSPQTFRTPQEVDDFKRLLAALDKHREVSDFEQTIQGFPFVKQRTNHVVDATQDDPATPAGPLAYMVHDCWLVLYTVDKSGLPAMRPTNAKINKIVIFCQREGRGPDR